jgi:hypothetical protein
MRKLLFVFLFLFLVLMQISCGTRARNYKDAYIELRNDTTFIKLKGKRVPLHNFGTYEDSTFIPIPKAQDGRIEGKDIPRPSGYFKYQGYILINKNKLTVKLLIDDIIDKELRKDTWNGEYNLIK